MTKNSIRPLRYHTDGAFLLSLSHYETWKGIHGRTAASDSAKTSGYKWLSESLILAAARYEMEPSYSTQEHPCGCFTVRVRGYGEITFQPQGVYHTQADLARNNQSYRNRFPSVVRGYFNGKPAKGNNFPEGF